MTSEPTAQTPPPPRPPPAPAAPPAAASAGPLTEAQYRMLRLAGFARREATKVARTARISAVVTLVIGVASLPFSLLPPSWVTLVMLAVCAVGIVEYVGSKRLNRADPAAAGMLVKNQLAFLAVIVIYCAVKMATFTTASFKAAAISPEFRQYDGQFSMIGDFDKVIDRWGPLLVYGFYCLVILVSVGCQGGLALYYLARKHKLAEYRRQTPDWVNRLFVEMGA